MEPSDVTPEAQTPDTPPASPQPSGQPDSLQAAETPPAPGNPPQVDDADAAPEPTSDAAPDAEAGSAPAQSEPLQAQATDDPPAPEAQPSPPGATAPVTDLAAGTDTSTGETDGDVAAEDDDEHDEDDDEPHGGPIEQNPEAVSHDSTADGLSTPAATGSATPDTPGAEAGDAAEPTETPAVAEAPRKAKAKPKKPAGPEPAEVVRRIGRTNEQALAYVLDPDPKLSRLSRKAREALITEVPPVTAGALLGPEALARHFIASAAAGRYRDLFSLWELFRARPEECKPVLAERQRALDRGRKTLTTAVRLGLAGQADRVAEDVGRAQGLIWTWLREILVNDLKAVGRRPRVAAALLAREPELDIPLPESPDDRWLAEAAAAKQDGTLTPEMDALLSANIERLPATVATLSQVSEQYPERLAPLVDRIDLESESIGALLAWARDHGMGDRIRSRIVAQIEEASAKGRAEGLHAWQEWRDRGVDVELPAALRAPTIEGLDLSRAESAELIAQLVAGGADIDPQAELEQLAAQNRQAAEKAYEAFVCARLDVHLPLALEGNPIVRDGTRCPACQAWTWVRPGHENRCPRLQEGTVAAS